MEFFFFLDFLFYFIGLDVYPYSGTTLLRLPLCSFVVSFEIRKYESSNLFLFKICFGFEGPLRFHMNFRMGFSISVKKHCWDFDREYIKSALSSIAILIVSFNS